MPLFVFFSVKLKFLTERQKARTAYVCIIMFSLSLAHTLACMQIHMHKCKTRGRRNNKDSNNIDVDIWRCRHLRLSASSLSIRSLRCRCHFCSHFSSLSMVLPPKFFPALTPCCWLFGCFIYYCSVASSHRNVEWVYATRAYPADTLMPCIKSGCVCSIFICRVYQNPFQKWINKYNFLLNKYRRVCVVSYMSSIGMLWDFV